ncbi:CYTH domain-containing protein [Phyllobacterium endophyticum]|uniref:CYTH domain-containing protein n=1 Tax=Phyllobacterium endophyticum TaxID=1149773 RepID=UPI0011CC94CF|nr:CYTH domain-containing protein [Phyllobacterium endophyticum]TXR50389.1 CYTH domain-containing protein [Phyllobacterium endophyticum]
MAASDRNTEKQVHTDNGSPHSAPVETELKLRTIPGALDQVRISPTILQSARNKGTIRRLEATHYDTTDHRLFDAGLSLRVRRSGKRFTKTIKRLSVNDPLTRDEWEAPVATLAPDLAVMQTAEIHGIFHQIAVDELVPIFVTKVRWQAIALDVPEGADRNRFRRRGD